MIYLKQVAIFLTIILFPEEGYQITYIPANILNFLPSDFYVGLHRETV